MCIKVLQIFVKAMRRVQRKGGVQKRFLGGVYIIPLFYNIFTQFITRLQGASSVESKTFSLI